MTSLHATSHVTRLVLGTLAALALLAATSAAAASAPVTSDQFAPGWQTHAHALIFMGQARTVDRDKWYVPGILPRGEYVLVKRVGDKAELIDGYRFNVTSARVDQYLYLMPGQGEVQALPVADVPSLKPARAPVFQQ
jgi:hypothetical protein